MSDLAIKIVVDGSQVPAGMTAVSTTVEAATARIKAAFGSVAKAPEGIRNALMILQNQARMSGETVAFATEQINALGGASSGAAPQVQRLSNSTDQATRSLVEARLAAQLFGREIGVTMPRALTTVLARSETLGPALNAAFSGIALVGFIELATVAGEKLSQLISDAFIFTDAEKKLYAQEVSLNQKILHGLEEHKKLLRDISVIGLPLAEAEKKRAQFAREDADGLKSQIEQSEKQLQLEKEKLQVLQRQKSEAASRTINVGRAGIRSADQGQFDQAIKDQEIAVRTLSDSIVGLRSDYTLAGDAVVAAQKKFDSTALKDSEKAATKFQAAMEKLARELRHISDEKERLDILTRKLAEDQSEFAAKEAAKETEAAAKGLIERNEAERQFRQDRIDDEKQSSLTAIEIEEEKVKERFRLGKITADQEVQLLNALDAQKLSIEKAYLDQRINTILARLTSDDDKTYKEDLKEWSKLLSDKQKAEDDYLKKRQKNIDGAATIEEKRWEKLTQKINSAFDQSIHGLIQGTITFGRAFANVLDSLLGDFISFLVKQALKWAENHLLMLAQHSAFLSSKLGLDSANQAATTAVNAAAASLQVTQQAGVAGAAGFASVMEVLPFPVNVSVAPGVMASSIAQTLSNLSLASAAGGFDVPHDMLAMIHKNEMVLPANLSSGLKDLIGNGSGSGDVHVHYSPTVHAVDARGVGDFFRNNEAELVRTIRRAARKGNVL